MLDLSTKDGVLAGAPAVLVLLQLQRGPTIDAVVDGAAGQEGGNLAPVGQNLRVTRRGYEGRDQSVVLGCVVIHHPLQQIDLVAVPLRFILLAPSRHDN